MRASIDIDMSRASVRRGEQPGLKTPALYDVYRERIAAMCEELASGTRQAPLVRQ